MRLIRNSNNARKALINALKIIPDAQRPDGEVFFDWYQASFSKADISPDDLAFWLSYYYEGAIVADSGVQKPYKQAVAIIDPKTVDYPQQSKYCTIHFGGHNDRFLVRFTSDRAIEGSEYLRSRFPDHIVSRADAAIDFDEGEGGFEKMARWFMEYAEAQGLKLDQRGDWLNAHSGRTLYIGSRKSLVYIRIYEKGIEQIQKNINHDASTTWFRVEFEIKPQTREGKVLFSKIAPEKALDCSPTMREFKEVVMNKLSDPISVAKVRELTSQDQAFRHMCYQYGKTLERELMALDGDCEAFARKILDTVREQREARKSARAEIATLKQARKEDDSEAAQLSPLLRSV